MVWYGRSTLRGLTHAAARCAARQLRRDLRRTADERGLVARVERDRIETKMQHTAEELLEKLEKGAQEVFNFN